MSEVSSYRCLSDKINVHHQRAVAKATAPPDVSSCVCNMTRFNAGTRAEPYSRSTLGIRSVLYKYIQLHDGHDNTVRLARVDCLARLLDGLEDGLIRELFFGVDFSGLLLEGDIEGFNT